MNPTTPTTPGPAMSHGGTFMRPGAVGWGRSQPDADRGTPEAIEQALAAAASDPDRVTDLLDELSRGRLWVPLPDDRPVTDGSAVLLPTVTYLRADFVPAFTSPQRLADWLGRATLADGETEPYVVVPAAELARRLPAGLGIALNPGAEASVPIYPEGVRYLATALVVTEDAQVRVGRPPADPVVLLSEVRTALDSIPDVRQASRTWLSIPGAGEGLVISVTLHDPACEAVHKEVLDAIEQAVHAAPEQGFPIDVTFPGESEPDQVDDLISAHAEPFYIRS
jgi:SseB protein N-terminal domain/SseB protein C-terminal domain